jgi:hydrogenase expression/formation protein HypC
MCLAVPGRVVEAEEREGNRVGKVQFGGITREAFLNFVPEAGIGDYVLVHAGFAISRVDPDEAKRVYETIELLSDLGEES